MGVHPLPSRPGSAPLTLAPSEPPWSAEWTQTLPVSHGKGGSGCQRPRNWGAGWGPGWGSLEGHCEVFLRGGAMTRPDQGSQGTLRSRLRWWTDGGRGQVGEAPGDRAGLGRPRAEPQRCLGGRRRSLNLEGGVHSSCGLGGRGTLTVVFPQVPGIQGPHSLVPKGTA